MVLQDCCGTVCTALTTSSALSATTVVDTASNMSLRESTQQTRQNGECAEPEGNFDSGELTIPISGCYSVSFMCDCFISTHDFLSMNVDTLC